jgi:hypothetical protein
MSQNPPETVIEVASHDLFAVPLLPCPFCGEAPWAGIQDPGAPFPGGYYAIECHNLACEVAPGAVIKARTEDGPATAKRVIEAWNHRPANDQGLATQPAPQMPE